MIQYYNTCTDSIRTIPTLIYNENRGRVEDLNTEGEDHAADVDRYFLVSLRGYAVKHPITEMQRKQDTFKLMQSQDMRGYPTKEVQKRMTNLPQIPSYEDS